MKIKIKLLSNTIFGSGQSVPGGEDIAILHDKDGFPYLKASTFKGIFREEFENYCSLTNELSKSDINLLFGKSGINEFEQNNSSKLYFSDFKISQNIRSIVLNEIHQPNKILNAFTDLYTFTSIENGISKQGSLRCARCIKKGIIFYGDIICKKEHEEIIKNVLKMIRFMGNMKTRGFGKVLIEVVNDND